MNTKTTKIFLSILLTFPVWTAALHAQDSLNSTGTDASIWIALFGLAIVGVFALYLSSEKIKELTRQFATMQAAQKEIETRQNVLLGVIGERLETSTHGIRRHREVFEGQSRESLDWDVINSEMTRFRRDESLLIDAMQDLQDFAKIRSAELELESTQFGITDMLKRLSHQVDPHYFLKRNELVYRLDPEQLAYITGDSRRLEQILSVILIELGQGVYDSTVILSMAASPSRNEMTFDVLVPQSDEGVQMLDALFVEEEDIETAQHSSRRLKSYIARELIRLMGGELRSVLDHEEGIHYRIDLPLPSEASRTALRSVPDVPLLVVTHNEPAALSVSDMLIGRLSPGQIDVHIAGDGMVSDLSVYESIVITYAALQQGWTERLRILQKEYPIRLVVLKNGFERNLPISEELKVTQVLRMPLLPEKLAEALERDPEETMVYDAVAS